MTSHTQSVQPPHVPVMSPQFSLVPPSVMEFFRTKGYTFKFLCSFKDQLKLHTKGTTMSFINLVTHLKMDIPKVGYITLKFLPLATPFSTKLDILLHIFPILPLIFTILITFFSIFAAYFSNLATYFSNFSIFPNLTPIILILLFIDRIDYRID